MYYGWAIKDDKPFCREAYVDAAAVQAHLDNIVPAVGEMRDAAWMRVARRDQLHGPEGGLATFKELVADSLGGVYWDVASSFSKFKMPSFKLGPFSYTGLPPLRSWGRHSRHLRRGCATPVGARLGGVEGGRGRAEQSRVARDPGACGCAARRRLGHFRHLQLGVKTRL